MTLQLTEPRTRHWTLAEYYQLAEQGWFDGQRVQLLEGEIIQMPAQGHAHFKSLSLISRWLERSLGTGYWVRVQGPLSVSPDSDPEPDIAVVPGPIEQYKDHPQSALLVIEVADSSLRLDRRKASVYSAAAVAEYWIVDLGERRVEIYRQPSLDASGTAAYPPPSVATENQTVSPLSVPAAAVKVAELLP